MALSIQRMEEQDFAALRTEWNALLARSASDTFFLRWEWMYTWWETFKQDRSLWILLARLDDRLVGIAPFYLERANSFPKARMLRFCSDELSPDYLDVIVEKGSEALVFQAFQQAIVARKTEWDMLLLEDLLKESVVLQQVLLFPSRRCRTDPSPDCPYILIEGSFDTYIQKQRATKNLSVRELKKKERKLFENPAISHVTLQDERRLPQAIDDLFLLHERRAAQKGIRTNFASKKIQEFHCKLGRRLLKENMLDLQFLYHAQAPISAAYSFKYHNKLYRYQQGMDPRWSRLSVGTVLHKLILEKAFAEGLSELDLLKGEEAYKKEWATGYRQEVTLTVFNPSIRGWLMQVQRQLKDSLRRYVKPMIKGVVN